MADQLFAHVLHTHVRGDALARHTILFDAGPFTTAHHLPSSPDTRMDHLGLPQVHLHCPRIFRQVLAIPLRGLSPRRQPGDSRRFLPCGRVPTALHFGPSLWNRQARLQGCLQISVYPPPRPLQHPDKGVSRPSEQDPLVAATIHVRWPQVCVEARRPARRCDARDAVRV